MHQALGTHDLAAEMLDSPHFKAIAAEPSWARDAASAKQLADMQRRLQQGLDEGALGVGFRQPQGAPGVDRRVTHAGEKELPRHVVGAGEGGEVAVVIEELEGAQMNLLVAAEGVAEARAIVAAYERALADGSGAIELDGRMIDVPVAERARAVVATAERIASRAR